MRTTLVNPAVNPITAEIAATPLTQAQLDNASFRMLYNGGLSTAPFATLMAKIASLPSKVPKGAQRDLQLWYLAPCDGTSHPMTQAAALAMYPNCGATGTIEQDTAAWLQAEYDFRTGTGGTICLASGAIMMVSQSLFIQNADKVYFYGTAQNCILRTAQCLAAGLIPLHIANAHNVGLVCFGFALQAQNGPATLSNSSTGPGTPATGYTVGATAIFIEQCQGIDLERIAWNGFDEAIKWGDNTYGICFRNGGGSGNNKAFPWSETTGLNSMERIRFEGGALAGNNYGFYINAVYPGNNEQGGSIFITDSAIDYNYVQHGVYIGAPAGNAYCLSSLHVTGCHIETSSDISGTAKCRFLSQGVFFLTDNEIYELQPAVPLGIVEVADASAAFISNNRVNAANMAMAWSGTANNKKVEAYCNTMQFLYGNVVALLDGTGIRLQPDGVRDGACSLLFNDASSGDWVKYYKQTIMFDYYNGDGTFTLPSRATFAFYQGYCGVLVNAGKTTITLAIDTGKLTNIATAAALKMGPGAIVYIRMHDAGSNEWIVAGGLTS